MNKKIWLLALPLVFLALVVWVVLWGEHTYRISGIKAKGKLSRKGVVEGLELSSSKEGKLSWLLRSQKAQVKGNLFLLEGVEITYKYAPDKTIVVHGKYGEVDQKKQIGRMWGGVVVTMGRERLTTSELVWDLHRNRVSTSKRFSLTGRYMVEGRGFELFPNKGKVKVKHLRKAVIF